MANSNKRSIRSNSTAAAAAETAEEEASRTVFIDTTLDTHFLMPLSCDDTVSGFKRKIEKEHMLCFSNIGEVLVHALKVKRRGRFYYLSDSMLVKDAFGLVCKNWFLSVDASIVEKKHDEKGALPCNLDSNNLFACFGALDNTSVDGVVLPLKDTPEQGTSDDLIKASQYENDKSRHGILEQRNVLVEEASEPDLAVKKRKRKSELIAVNGDLQVENVGSGEDIFEPAMISQTSLEDKERIKHADLDGLAAVHMDSNHLVMNDSITRKSKKSRKSKHKLDQVSNGFPSSGKDVLGKSYVAGTGGHKDLSGEVDVGNNAKTPSESGVISTEQKHSNAIRETGEQDTHPKTDETEEETSAQNKMETSKDHPPVDVESIPPPVVKEPEDPQMDMGVSGHKDIGIRQDERVEEQEALSTKNDSSRMQSNGLDSKDVNVTADLVDENGNVLPTDTGKKRRRKKIRRLDEEARTTSTGPNVQGSETNVSAEPLGTKRGEQPDDSVGNEESNLSPAKGNEVLKEKIKNTSVAKEDDGTGSEVKTIDNKERPVNVEEQPVRKKLKKKQKPSANNLPDVQVHSQDVIHQNSTLQTVSKTEVVASLNTEKETDVWVSSQAEIVEVQGGALSKNYSSKIHSNDLGSANQNETEVKGNAVDMTAELEDENGGVVPTDTGKKRKISKKPTKGSAGNLLTTLSGRDVQGSETNFSAEPLRTKGGEQPDDRARNEESNLSPTDGNEVIEENTKSTIVAKEDDGLTVNKVKIMENQEKPVNVEEDPVKKKSKKKQKPSTEDIPNVLVEPRDVIHQNPVPPTVTKSEVVASSNTKKKGKTGKPIKDQHNRGKLESENFGVRADPVPAEPKSVSTKAQPHSLDNGLKEGSDEADLADNPPKNSSADKDNNLMEVSEMGDKSILEKPLPDIVASDEVPLDKKRIPSTAGNTPKAKKNAKNRDTLSVQTSSNVQSSLKSNGKQRTVGKPPAVNSSTILVQDSRLEEKSDESKVHPGRKSAKASGKAAKTLPSDVSSLNSIHKEAASQNVVNDATKKTNSGKITGSTAVSNPRVERLRKVSAASNKLQSGAVTPTALAGAKVSNKDNSATIKSSETKKKLIATPGSIFKDDSDVSSGNEGSDDSDASTRTPSDFSSDYSDGEESNADFKSPQKGSYTSDKTKSVDKRNILKSCSSGGKDFTLDTILRSSSRYRKAKLTAAELQFEEESQQVDFVPDSQPNR